MSHAQGQVLNKQGEIVSWFEYDGTHDIALERLYETDDELNDNWRKGAPSRCECGGEPTEVFLWSSYGGGFHWPAKVCIACRAIVTNRRPYEDFERDSGWPKSGIPEAQG